jgi:hypothetical protein
VGRAACVLAGLITLLAGGSASANAPEPVIGAVPQIAGTATVGSQLTASAGAWTPPSASPSYQWRRCDSLGGACEEIPGATQLAYTVTLADAGHALVIQLTVTHNGGTSAPAQSPPTVVVPPVAPVVLVGPVIAGIVRDGERLTGQPGAWTGSAPIALAYAWLRCDAQGAGCVPVGATAATYDVQAADVGHTLRFAVTASNAGGAVTVPSEPTLVVVARGVPASPVVTPPPAVPAAPPGLGTPAPVTAGALIQPVAGPAPVAASRRRLMTPFPVVRIAGRVSGRTTTLTLVSVKAPAGARIDVTCRRPRCALRRQVRRRGALRIHRLERAFPSGTVISIRVTAAGAIGKYTRVVARTGRAPARTDRCLTSRTAKPVRCPAG